jgi:AcrR family transcriptional regulator
LERSFNLWPVVERRIVAQRRPRAATEEKRRRILDATEEIMLEEGYAAVSSRSVAAAVGITAPLVHYHFPTIDDLFVAVLQRRAGHNVDRMAAALASPEPLRAWWELASDPRGTALFVELMAAANHRPALKIEVGAVARRFRAMQLERLATLLDEYWLDADDFPPALVAAAMQGVAFGIVSDQAAGYDTAADEAAAAASRLIGRLEERRARHRR